MGRRRLLLFGLLLAACGGDADDSRDLARSWWTIPRAPDATDADVAERLAATLENETAVQRSWVEITGDEVRGVLTFRAGVADSARAKAIARVTNGIGMPEGLTSAALRAPLGVIVLTGQDQGGRIETARSLARDLATVPDIATVRLEGADEARVVVELDALALGTRGLTASDVHAALADVAPEGHVPDMLADALITPEARLSDLGSVLLEFDESAGGLLFDGKAAVAVYVESDAEDTGDVWDAIDALVGRTAGAKALREAPARRWVLLPPDSDAEARERRAAEVSRDLVARGAEHVLVSSRVPRFPRALPAPLEERALEVSVWGDPPLPGGLGPSVDDAPFSVLTGGRPDDLASLATLSIGVGRWSEPPLLLGAETRQAVDVQVDAASAATHGLDVEEVLAQVRGEWRMGDLLLRLPGRGLEDASELEVVDADGEALPLRSIADVRTDERAARGLFVDGVPALFLVGGSPEELESALELELPGAARLAPFD